MHIGLEDLAQYYPDDDRKLGHEALAFVHRGMHVVLTGGTTDNPATSVAGLTTARKIQFVDAMREGMAALTLTVPNVGTIEMTEVTNAKQFYTVLQQLKQIRTPRDATAPIVWADPRGSGDIVRIPLAYVLDFSGADGIPQTPIAPPANLPTTGLGLTNDMFPDDTDFITASWIDELT